MEYKVVSPFRDKTNGMKKYKVGDIYTHEDFERIKLLTEKGFLEKPSDENTKEKDFTKMIEEE